MNFGRCAFKKCRNEAGVCVEDGGKPLIVCRQHWEYLSELHARDIIEAAFTLKGGDNVRVHN